MVQNVDCRPLEVERDVFPNLKLLDHAQVEVEITWTAEAVDREVAEGARGRSRHQSWLQGRSDSLAGGGAGRPKGYVKEFRIDKEHAGRGLEEPDVLLKLFEGNPRQLRSDVRRGAIEGRAAGGHIERRAGRPGDDS